MEDRHEVQLEYAGRYTGETPFLLSGGIAADDAGHHSGDRPPKLAGIDLNSEFEISTGLKSVEM